MHKVKYTNVPLYHGRFILCLSDEPDKLNKEFTFPKKQQYDEYLLYADTWSEFNYKNKGAFLIVLNFNYKYSGIGRKITHGTIAHEVNHVGNIIMGKRGVKKDFDNDEPESYLKEWIVDTVYKWIKELGYYDKIK